MKLINKLYNLTTLYNYINMDIIDYISHNFYGSNFAILKYDKGISQHLYNKNTIWENHILDLIYKYIKPNTTILDIGANIGTHTVGIINFFKNQSTTNTKIISFEPQQTMYKLLCHNIKQSNPTIEYEAYCVGLSNKNDIIYNIVPDYRTTDNPGGDKLTFNYVPSNSEREEKVEIKTLDSYELTNVSFIKIDVEEHENEVIKGAETLIKENKPVMIVEILGGYPIDNANEEQCKYITDTIKYIESLGYKSQLISFSDYLFLPLNN
jgi:FkbM family methyltransferase